AVCTTAGSMVSGLKDVVGGASRATGDRPSVSQSAPASAKPPDKPVHKAPDPAAGSTPLLQPLLSDQEAGVKPKPRTTPAP
ncbi:MAG: hypothetical protein RL375_2217, partial [Pseudomonadota bacterium]